MEALAKALLGGAKGTGTNFDKFAKILTTPQGKAVVEALMSDGGKSLQKAAEDARRGNIDTARRMLSAVAATTEGAEILQKILAAASE